MRVVTSTLAVVGGCCVGESLGLLGFGFAAGRSVQLCARGGCHIVGLERCFRRLWGCLRIGFLLCVSAGWHIGGCGWLLCRSVVGIAGVGVCLGLIARECVRAGWHIVGLERCFGVLRVRCCVGSSLCARDGCHIAGHPEAS